MFFFLIEKGLYFSVRKDSVTFINQSTCSKPKPQKKMNLIYWILKAKQNKKESRTMLLTLENHADSNLLDF